LAGVGLGAAIVVITRRAVGLQHIGRAKRRSAGAIFGDVAGGRGGAAEGAGGSHGIGRASGRRAGAELGGVAGADGRAALGARREQRARPEAAGDVAGLAIVRRAIAAGRVAAIAVDAEAARAVGRGGAGNGVCGAEDLGGRQTAVEPRGEDAAVGEQGERMAGAPRARGGLGPISEDRIVELGDLPIRGGAGASISHDLAALEEDQRVVVAAVEHGACERPGIGGRVVELAEGRVGAGRGGAAGDEDFAVGEPDNAGALAAGVEGRAQGPGIHRGVVDLGRRRVALGRDVAACDQDFSVGEQLGGMALSRR